MGFPFWATTRKILSPVVASLSAAVRNESFTSEIALSTVSDGRGVSSDRVTWPICKKSNLTIEERNDHGLGSATRSVVQTLDAPNRVVAEHSAFA
ncbi:hypothetical protein WR25_20005 [Diploscapter pachys]|uniref:Uncharacterized protein n=1 Tax=Diploscapter pachys TaxID=2018661 RepID=A0A2A2LEA1_9BILA|nr:hypothetical protein WR25_20005 [Diploscapter pachys]